MNEKQILEEDFSLENSLKIAVTIIAIIYIAKYLGQKKK